MKEKHKKQFALIFVILLLVAIIAILLFKNSSARYTHETDWQHAFYTNGFYITSNLLGKESMMTIINDYDYSNINLKIKNHEGKYKITNYDVNYKLECQVEETYENDFSCIVDDKNTNVIENIIPEVKKCYQGDNIVELDEEECNTKGYEFKSGPNETDHNIKIINKTNNQSATEVKVNIVLTTTNPYQIILKGSLQLNLEKKPKIKLDVKNENNRYCDIVFTNESTKEKQLTVTIDSEKFGVDTSSNWGSIVEKDEDGRINKLNLNLASSEQIQFKLFKKSQEYSCNENAISYSVQN